jgi:hypothetical protein
LIWVSWLGVVVGEAKELVTRPVQLERDGIDAAVDKKRRTQAGSVWENQAGWRWTVKNE